MYLYDTIKGESARQFCQTMLKLDGVDVDLDTVNRIEIMATRIDDPGDDYCEYRVIDCQGKVLAVRRELGY